jgi:hypothetical protein
LPSGLRGNFNVEIIDASGKPVQSTRLVLNGSRLSVSLNLSALPRGVYFIRALSDEVTFTKKLVKE